MNATDYEDYIACFNANDFDGFGKYYHDDVVFNLGDKKQIIGRENILDFYRDVKSKVRETLDVVSSVGNEDFLAVHVRTEFFGLEDWPDFIAGPLMKGEAINIESLGYYYLKDGKFAEIMGARYKTLPTVPAQA
ncbi:nuclear transport factor 2 family protein [Parasphingopyxis marina]|uniref:Nuclear transport factor 2 family protein n=1 Tax=Parasphingopyxis marina TaxID=2761622 RepID=A0A842HSF6_9SPHN|nr:nuclear transport factor 2 family protein [Parasphingopyxis marina]MBC2776006.1 nuclear transport factor 2 family protein [Parasphingopyxis marina]